MRRVLLFGSSGFIGGQVKAALAAGTEVIAPGRDRHDLINGSVGDLAELVGETAPDAVVCCVGAITGTASDLINANAQVAAKLLEAAGDIRKIRLGSAGEYGIVPHGRSVAEDDRTDPVGAYGVSHLAGTKLFALGGGISIRVFNPIGAGQPAENVLGRAARRIREALDTGADEITLGPLGAYRDFVDVQDVASLIRAVVLAPEVPSTIYNCGSGRAVTVREAVGLLAAQAGWSGTIREVGAGPQRSAAVDWIRADITRAGTELGWQPAQDLGTSIKNIWAAG